ncbi:MAG: hypothetical protein AMXMBFR22_31990 [Phycisphaerae bacterium]
MTFPLLPESVAEDDPAAEALANVHDALAAVLEQSHDKGRCLPADLEMTEESGPVPEDHATFFNARLRPPENPPGCDRRRVLRSYDCRRVLQDSDRRRVLRRTTSPVAPAPQDGAGQGHAIPTPGNRSQIKIQDAASSRVRPGEGLTVSFLGRFSFGMLDAGKVRADSAFGESSVVEQEDHHVITGSSCGHLRGVRRCSFRVE